MKMGSCEWAGGCEKDVFRAAHTHTPFFWECPPWIHTKGLYWFKYKFEINIFDVIVIQTRIKTVYEKLDHKPLSLCSLHKINIV